MSSHAGRDGHVSFWRSPSGAPATARSRADRASPRRGTGPSPRPPSPLRSGSCLHVRPGAAPALARLGDRARASRDGPPRRPGTPRVVRARASSSSVANDAPRGADSAPAPRARSRRDALAALTAAFAAACASAGPPPPPAFAAYGASSGAAEDADGASRGGPVAFTTFYGAAAPPATYGYLGGTTPDKAKYSYDVPSDWVEEAPSKVEKGAGGQDSRFVKAGSRGATRCSVLTLNRAGEDGAAFDLTDGALAAIAGADSKLQESINGEGLQGTRAVDYVTFPSPGHLGEYVVKITVDNTGRLFAFVLNAERVFKGGDQEDGQLGRELQEYESVAQGSGSDRRGRERACAKSHRCFRIRVGVPHPPPNSSSTSCCLESRDLSHDVRVPARWRFRCRSPG